MCPDGVYNFKWPHVDIFKGTPAQDFYISEVFCKVQEKFFFDSASIGRAMLILHIQYCTLCTRNVYFKTDICLTL
jgi:hypothetical protein